MPTDSAAPLLYPPSMNGTQHDLSPEARAEIMALNEPAPWRWLLQTGILWASVALFITASELAGHWLVTVLAIVLIGSRQLALGFMVHEQAHYAAFRFKGGDIIANLLAAYPLLVVTSEKYAQVHLSHHQHYFTVNDPDFVRKNGPAWTYPKTRGDVIRQILTELLGLNLVKLIKGKTLGDVTLYQRLGRIPAWVKPAYYLTCGLVFTYFGIWLEFLLYWVLPLVTVMQAFLRWAAICEHQYGIEGARPEDTTPLIILPWWQRLLIPDVNFGMHIYHHYFPGVPFCHLPKLHRIFRREGLVHEDRVFHGYGQVFKAVTGGLGETREETEAARA
jgi:fatty acid desaturase